MKNAKKKRRREEGSRRFSQQKRRDRVRSSFEESLVIVCCSLGRLLCTPLRKRRKCQVYNLSQHDYYSIDDNKESYFFEDVHLEDFNFLLYISRSPVLHRSSI